MNTYSDENPPRKGTAKIIYAAFKAQGWLVKDLHYNPNCWGNASGANGWGTWACEIWGSPYGGCSSQDNWFFCGVKNGIVYLQNLSAPFNAFPIAPSNTACTGQEPSSVIPSKGTGGSCR